MAYNKKETQVTLGYITKSERRGEYIKVSRIIPDGGGEESLDARLMYTADEGKDVPRDEKGLSPTSKGFRLKSENIAEFVSMIIKGMNEDEKADLEGYGIDISGMMIDANDTEES